MICKEGIDVISIGGEVITPHQQQQQQHQHSNRGNGILMNGHHTLQPRRKSQLITFSSSPCDMKNSLSHEVILVNSAGSNNTANSNSNSNSNNNGARNSITGSSSNGSGGCGNFRLSFAEEDIMIVTSNGGSGNGGTGSAGSASVTGSGTESGTGSGTGSGQGDIEDDLFRRRSLEMGEEIGELYDDEFETHIEALNNANDDSGGGSYEDSHALHSSIGGSNRNSLEKDDDDIEVDVISTDVSCCYDQLLGTSCNTRNYDDDADERSTIVGDGEHFTKICKSNGINDGEIGSGGRGGGGNSGGGGGVIYANPFMDDEGIAESGM